MPSIGWTELIVILVIILVIFGPKRLPEIGRSLGKGIKEFKKSTTELQEHITGDPTAPTVERTEKVEETRDAAPASPDSEGSENSST